MHVPQVSQVPLPLRASVAELEAVGLAPANAMHKYEEHSPPRGDLEFGGIHV